MKVRKGFISNSSSTSFICDICAESVGGYDMGLEEADMFTCENSHTFCRDHTVGGREVVENQIDEDGEGIDPYEIPSKYCPCCMFDKVADFDIVAYFLKEKGMTREEVASMFKDRFKTYDEFNKYTRAE